MNCPRTLAPLFGLTALAAALLTPAYAQTVTVTDLNPAAPLSSYGGGVSGSTQVGRTFDNHNTHAVLWRGTPGSVIDLHPTGFPDSLAEGVDGNTQVGQGFEGDFFTVFHALLWHGTADSVVDLHPAGFTYSNANAVSGNTQVGSGYGQKADGTYFNEALLWHGTADSVVDLHPTGFVLSAAVSVSGDAEVGYAQDANYIRHALLWRGTANSVIDLHPAGFQNSQALGVSGSTQVGYGENPLAGTSTTNAHALLWHGAAGSVVDLNPAGFDGSQATGVSGDAQVGFGYNQNANGEESNLRVLLWRGSAASAVDLSKYLPAETYLDPAYGISVSGSGNVYDVVATTLGTYNDGSYRFHAILWHVVFPTAYTLTSLSPASRTQGREGFALTVNGGGFTPQSVIVWNGQAQPTTFVSSNRVTAQIPASLIASAGTAQITVKTPGVGTTNARTETINPRPVLSSLNPAVGKTGGPDFTLTAAGTGFLPDSIIKWNGEPQPTVFVSSTRLTARIPAALVKKTRTVKVTVTSPQVATSGYLVYAIRP